MSKDGGDAGRFAPPDTVPRALGRLRVALDDAYIRASRELGLTAQQAELLCVALRPAGIGDLAYALRCDRSNVSRLVDRASMRGLVRRRQGQDDARVSMIELSARGRRLALTFIEALESQLEALLAEWSDERQHAAVALLNEISETLDRGRPALPRRRPAREAS